MGGGSRSRGRRREGLHRGEIVKPTETAINNFERECRSFNGINVDPRAAAAAADAAATRSNISHVCGTHVHCATCRVTSFT